MLRVPDPFRDISKDRMKNKPNTDTDHHMSTCDLLTHVSPTHLTLPVNAVGLGYLLQTPQFPLFLFYWTWIQSCSNIIVHIVHHVHQKQNLVLSIRMVLWCCNMLMRLKLF